MELRVTLPPATAYRRSADLEGEGSRAAPQAPLWWILNRKDDPDWWYGAAEPAEGWTGVVDAPLRARQ